MNRYTLHNDDNLNVLRAMPDNSVDSIVTDPPYGINMLGKKWDYDVPSVELWTECLRVLKPGGHLLAFAGTRTQHRMAVRIEDAGFEIRDLICWLYGQGFPKSVDISKHIDKRAGAEREVLGKVRHRGGPRAMCPTGGERQADPSTYITEPVTEEAKKWQGWGSALKPSMEPVTLARKPFDTTIAENVLTYGTGGLNIEGCRVGTESVTINTWDNGAKPFGDGAGNPFTSRISAGRWPANTIHDGSDEVVRLFPDAGGGFGKRGGGNGGEWNPTDRETKKGQTIRGGGEMVGYGDSGSAARFFYCAKASKSDRDEGCGDIEHQQRDESRKQGDPGGDNPRNRGVQQRANYHPTVKPTQLMQYLCRLVTPPNGIVLDPFMGSGSTGKAALLEGFRFIGIEKEPEYIAIAERRIAHASSEPSMPVSVSASIESVKQEPADKGQLSLFGGK